MKITKKQGIAIGIIVAVIAVILTTSLTLFFCLKSAGPFSGKVVDAESGDAIANVMITDGKNVVKTDENGKYTLKGYNKSRFVTMTVPSGYNAQHDIYYYPVDDAHKRDEYNFRLVKTSDYSEGHSFLQISDSEIDYKGIGEWGNHVKALVDETKPAFVVHTGDICYYPGLYTHKKAMNSDSLGVPVRYVIGNHDYINWGGYGEAFFESVYGPIWYSFDVGNVHYVVTPFQNGSDHPSGYGQNERWEWLQNDLANVDPSMKVVMFNHTTPPSSDYVIKYGSKTLDLKEHNLAAWAFGHYHYNYVEETVPGVLSICTARPDAGGIDSSPAGTRQVIFNGEGKISTKMHYFNYNTDNAPQDPQEKVWSTKLQGNALFADALVEGNAVYVGTSDDDYPMECGVYSVNADTGAVNWYYKTKNSVRNNMVYYDGKIIAQDAAGYVYCLNAADGTLVWDNNGNKIGLGNSFETNTGITASDGVVYLGNAAEITAVNISDGSIKWNRNRKYGECSPAEFVVAGNKLLVSSHWDALIALDTANGKVLWENKDTDLRMRSSTPVVIDENTALVADNQAVMIINLNNGNIDKRYNIKDGEGNNYLFSSSSKPIISGDIAYIATGNDGIVAVNYKTGELKWHFATRDSLIFTAPYTGYKSKGVESTFLVKDNALIFGANDGYLYRVNMEDGSLIKEINLGAPVLGKAALYQNDVIVADFSGRVLRLSI